MSPIRDIHSADHRAKLADRKEAPHGPHIDAEPKPDPMVYEGFEERMTKALEALAQQSERAAQVTLQPTAKRIVDWTMTPSFFLACGSTVAMVVVWLCVLVSGVQGQLAKQQNSSDRLVEVVTNMQRQVTENKAEAQRVSDFNKAEADKRAMNYIPIVEGLRNSQGIQDTRIQNMIESNLDFRKSIGDSITAMREQMMEGNKAQTLAVSKLTELMADMHEQVAMLRVQNAQATGQAQGRQFQAPPRGQ